MFYQALQQGLAEVKV